jgi:hypothetical protein
MGRIAGLTRIMGTAPTGLAEILKTFGVWAVELVELRARGLCLVRVSSLCISSRVLKTGKSLHCSYATTALDLLDQFFWGKNTEFGVFRQGKGYEFSASHKTGANNKINAYEWYSLT